MPHQDERPTERIQARRRRGWEKNRRTDSSGVGSGRGGIRRALSAASAVRRKDTSSTRPLVEATKKGTQLVTLIWSQTPSQGPSVQGVAPRKIRFASNRPSSPRGIWS